MASGRISYARVLSSHLVVFENDLNLLQDLSQQQTEKGYHSTTRPQLLPLPTPKQTPYK